MMSNFLPHFSDTTIIEGTHKLIYVLKRFILILHDEQRECCSALRWPPIWHVSIESDVRATEVKNAVDGIPSLPHRTKQAFLILR